MKFNHGCFGFSEESLKVEIFFSFFSSSYRGIRFSYFHRVILGTWPSPLSFNRFNRCLVSGVGIDTVKPESVTNRPSHTGLRPIF